jgi:hypothetical protein
MPAFFLRVGGQTRKFQSEILVLAIVSTCNFRHNNLLRILIFTSKKYKVRFPERAKLYLFFKASRQAMGFNQSSIERVKWEGSPGYKLTGHEAHHFPPSSAEVKNGLSCMLSRPAHGQVYSLLYLYIFALLPFIF